LGSYQRGTEKKKKKRGSKWREGRGVFLGFWVENRGWYSFRGSVEARKERKD